MEDVAWTPGLRGWLEAEARAAGFDAVGIAAAEPVGNASAIRDAERFAGWVDAGNAGEMDYLRRADEAGRLLRGGVRVALPWARSVVVCALNYNAEAVRSIDPAPPGAGWVGRYAWSGRRTREGHMEATDYHVELLGRLRGIEAALRERVACETRCYVDTGPLLERGLAAKAGIGWIGRNTCVLNQRLGSWLLLGVIATAIEVQPEVAATIAADRCGTCTRCIDACPTGALPAANRTGEWREMDASKCIAYLTIEKKGAIPEELRTGMGRQVFGCDICQDVCPWNRRAPFGEQMEVRRELVNPALEWLAAMNASQFKQWFKGSPLERTGRRRLLRNVAIAMGNSGDPKYCRTLAAWATGDDDMLREAAAWAIEKIEASASIDEWLGGK